MSVQQFTKLHREISSNKKLTASHKTRLERLAALYTHVESLERQRDEADNYYPSYKREALHQRLTGFKPSSFFLAALEALAAEVHTL